MKTKIANALFIFLLIICIIMLSILIYRRFYPPMTIRKESNARQTPVVKAIRKALPAVVTLQTSEILPEMKDTSVAGTGSIIDSSGLVLTNFHVVSKSRNIHVSLSSGVSYKAYLIAADPRNDIALLQLKNPQIGLPVIPVMRPWKLMPGETVIAVGNPYGLDGTITIGILSGINRALADGESVLFSDFLQTDAAVFPGNSGGPLINLDGCMIGMNMAVKRNAPGISFAVPLHRIENVLARYLIPEHMQNMYFGLIPKMEQNGKITVARVFPGSPAYRAGIRRGMEITALNGWDPKHDLLELSRRLIRLKPDQPVKIQLSTAGTLSVAPVPFSRYPAHIPIFWKLGIRAENLTPLKADVLRYPLKSGVIVSGHSRVGNPFRRGDVIVKWNRKTINHVEDLKKAVENAPIGSHAYALVYSVVDEPGKGRFLMSHVVRVTIR